MIEVISWTDRLKNEDVLQRIAEKKNILHTIKQKKPYWTWHQFTTLNQQNAHNFSLIFVLQYHTQYFCKFRSAKEHCQRINSKQYRI